MLRNRWRWGLRSIVHAGAVYVASQIVPGVHVQGWGATIAAVLLLGAATCVAEPALGSIRLLSRSPRWLLALVAGTLLWLTASTVSRVSGLAFQVDTVLAALAAAAVTKGTSFLLVRLGGL